ncbi:MAG: Asp-tRNA(Asn)/Glu-tRNA(Gln) amidotransferase subunit GatC [Candidatus Gracilibacteria bacterium]|nr:Asp-tRNA(Asn)/Glu-tRNA(Gln) amidotransferase subunit GatC [Candidatus Gracilibacteria bacterium]
MALTQDQIKHIARLSRLSLTEEQLEHYRQNLDSIVEYMDILKSVPAEALAKVADTPLRILPLREDEVHSSPLTRDQLLAVSSQKKMAGAIALPNIMG